MSNTLLHRIRQHQNLTELRNRLLDLHRVLLNIERNAYEQVRGRVSKGELLQLVIHHEQFAWLHRISELVVQIDEQLQADEPLTDEDVASLLTDARLLLTPAEEGKTFERKYYYALQREPDAVLAHAAIVKFLEAIGR
ncbi:MAG: hypothetical protein Kow00121_58670 [Elainellaceae cyanobacterium]